MASMTIAAPVALAGAKSLKATSRRAGSARAVRGAATAKAAAPRRAARGVLQTRAAITMDMPSAGVG